MRHDLISRFRANSPGRRPRGVVVGAVVGVALLAAAGLAEPASAASAAGANTKKAAAVATKCDGSQGWSAGAGRPAALVPGAPAGLYVWNAKGQWYVAATGPSRSQKMFQGSISFDAAITAKPAGAEGKSDVATVGSNSVSFTFRNFGRIDSVVVNAPCATTLTVTGTLDGVALTPAQILFGPSATPSSAAPAVFKRDTSSVAVVASAAGAEPAAACPTVAWPANTAGRPAALRKRSGAVHVWNEKASGAWQLVAIADAGKPALIEGRVTSNAPVVIQPLGLERADAVRVDGNSIGFSFRTNRAGDGFQFFAPCASQLSFEVSIDGAVINGEDLLVGSGAEAAPGIPLVISR